MDINYQTGEEITVDYGYKLYSEVMSFQINKI